MRPFGNTLTRAQNPSKLGTRERRIKRCSVQSALPLVKTTGSGIPNPSWAGLANTLEQATKPGAATIERHTPSHLHIRSPKTQTGPNPRRPTTRKLASLEQATQTVAATKPRHTRKLKPDAPHKPRRLNTRRPTPRRLASLGQAKETRFARTGDNQSTVTARQKTNHRTRVRFAHIHTQSPPRPPNTGGV